VARLAADLHTDVLQHPATAAGTRSHFGGFASSILSRGAGSVAALLDRTADFRFVWVWRGVLPRAGSVACAPRPADGCAGGAPRPSGQAGSGYRCRVPGYGSRGPDEGQAQPAA